MINTGENLPLFTGATEVRILDEHTYSINLVEAYGIGAVPNGGYVASCILRAASMHLARCGQPDTLSAHFEYINRCEFGPAIIVIENVKIGKSKSVIRIDLYQANLLPTTPWVTSTSRREISGFLTNTDIAAENGLSLVSGWTVDPLPPPVNFTDLLQGKDTRWTKKPKSTSALANAYAKAHQNLECFAPRNGQIRRGVEDTWIRLTCGERFTNLALGYVADAYPYVVEAWRPAKCDEQVPFGHDELLWYPTLSLNLDVKKKLPEGGVEWLFLRCIAKVIQNGRFDLEVLIMDQLGELVAISTHICAILSASRNLQGRNQSYGKI